MFCRKCGSQLNEGASFCEKCGFPASGVPLPKKESVSPVTWVFIAIGTLFGGVMVIGIIAAVAIPKFANTKEKALVAMEKANLRNLATAEEAYWQAHHMYSGDLESLKWTPAGRVTVAITSAGPDGWAAEAHGDGTAITCRVGFGADSIAGVGDGVITCGGGKSKPGT
jgi:type II secretory pathway pseudopilin PulG